MEKHYRTHVKWKQVPGCGQEPHILLSGALRWKFAGLERPALIAVGGPGGIGKTTFAKKMAVELREAVVLGLDDYKSPRKVREQKRIYGPHPEANEMKLLHGHLRQLRQGKTIEKPRYCRHQGKIHGTTSFAPDTFVIVEGEIATYKEFYGEIDFSIFIDSHWETQLNTRIRRDIERRGYTPEKAIATFLYSNLHEFAEYGAESKNWADVHIHCARDYTLTLDAVCSKAAAFLVEDVGSQEHFNLE